MDWFSAYLMGWDNILALILLIVGIVLLIVEMFMPGFGVIGGLGLLSLIVAMILRGEFLITFAISVVILSIAAFFIFRSFNRGLISRSPIVLNETINESSTSLSDANMQELVGLEGVCFTPLRPAGKADIGGKRYDVVTSGEFVKENSNILVLSVEGLRILVRETKDVSSGA